MKKLTVVLGLLVLMGSTGIASARDFDGYYQGPRASVAVNFPGLRLVLGRPGAYCWYQGRYYSWVDWDRYSRLHRDRFTYNRFHRDNDRRFDRDHDRF